HLLDKDNDYKDGPVKLMREIQYCRYLQRCKGSISAYKNQNFSEYLMYTTATQEDKDDYYLKGMKEQMIGCEIQLFEDTYKKQKEKKEKHLSYSTNLAENIQQETDVDIA